MSGIPQTDKATSLLTSFLNVQSKRAQLVAGNVANADTPGYQAKELDFNGYLRSVAEQSVSSESSSSLLESPRLDIVNETGSAMGMDGNNVDTAREMSTLAEAGTQFLFGTQLLQMRMRLLKTAIREGR